MPTKSLFCFVQRLYSLVRLSGTISFKCNVTLWAILLNSYVSCFKLISMWVTVSCWCWFEAFIYIVCLLFPPFLKLILFLFFFNFFSQKVAFFHLKFFVLFFFLLWNNIEYCICFLICVSFANNFFFKLHLIFGDIIVVFYLMFTLSNWLKKINERLSSLTFIITTK